VSKLAVLASGSGSNFEAMVHYFRQQATADIVLLLSDQPQAQCLNRAERLGVPAAAQRVRDFPDKDSYERWIRDTLLDSAVDMVVLAGYMRLCGPTLLQAFDHRILNIHPALLPSFPGKHAVEQALDYGVQVSGVTIHVVDEGMDTGPILYQEPVPVFAGDTPETLQKRIASVEHRMYPRVVEAYFQGEVTLKARRAIWKEEPTWDCGF